MLKFDIMINFYCAYYNYKLKMKDIIQMQKSSFNYSYIILYQMATYCVKNFPCYHIFMNN